MFARSCLLVALVGCAHSEVRDVRGNGQTTVAAVIVHPDRGLDAAGAAVAVLDDAAAARCAVIGFVTGMTTRRGIRLADQDRAQLVTTLARTAAIDDARDYAGANHATAIAIDADETWETGRAVRYLVHARALRCTK